MALEIDDILALIRLAKRDGWSMEFLEQQLEAYQNGKRGVELHDNTISTLGMGE